MCWTLGVQYNHTWRDGLNIVALYHYAAPKAAIVLQERLLVLSTPCCG